MPSAATTPSAIALWASSGGPATSPMAYTPFTDVSIRGETFTNPRSTWTPTVSRPTPAVFAARPTAQWPEILAGAGVPHGPIYEVAEALEDPHVGARGDIVEIDHPRFGAVRQLASPLRLGGEPNPLQRGPFRGEHTDELLEELCGYSADEIAELRAGGTFGAAPAPETA